MAKLKRPRDPTTQLPTDRSPGCIFCYDTERYVPRIGYLNEHERTQRYVLPSENTKPLLMYYNVLVVFYSQK
jgi:hypothetical protein